MSLARQFALAASIILFFGMAVVGIWVTRQIEDGVTRNTAASTALYMSSLVEPLVQELATRDTLSPERQADLDNLRSQTSLGRKIVSFKLWKEGGVIAYSSHKEIIGQRFDTTPNLRRAWKGEVAAEFDTLEDDEDVMERAAGVPLLEMYSPMREIGTGHIIAVAEFYETAEALYDNLFWANLKSWLVVGAVTLTIFALLSVIVMRGSRTIDRQRFALEGRVNELSVLLSQNEELRGRVQRASRRIAEVNEQYLRRVGADLHDGPAQLLALAALRLDALKPLLDQVSDGAGGPSGSHSDIQVVRESLTNAMSEIRNISTGLTLPELDNLSPRQLLREAAKAHERPTKTTVELDIQSAPEDLPKATKICLYRFVQETLSNAFRHAGGSGQRLSCRFDGTTLEVAVSDTGPGFDSSRKIETSHGLGLPGLRERVESIGGTLEVASDPGAGTKIVLRCNVAV
ncbi:MAG TPA: sensor histidine kinase [Thermohalobaculum sp.]|nr:sensor histidine kinase [Thermohalobaculum sp.]